MIDANGEKGKLIGPNILMGDENKDESRLGVLRQAKGGEG